MNGIHRRLVFCPQIRIYAIRWRSSHKIRSSLNPSIWSCRLERSVNLLLPVYRCDLLITVLPFLPRTFPLNSRCKMSVFWSVSTARIEQNGPNIIFRMALMVIERIATIDPDQDIFSSGRKSSTGVGWKILCGWSTKHGWLLSDTSTVSCKTVRSKSSTLMHKSQEHLDGKLIYKCFHWSCP